MLGKFQISRCDNKWEKLRNITKHYKQVIECIGSLKAFWKIRISAKRKADKGKADSYKTE